MQTLPLPIKPLSSGPVYIPTQLKSPSRTAEEHKLLGTVYIEHVLTPFGYHPNGYEEIKMNSFIRRAIKSLNADGYNVGVIDYARLLLGKGDGFGCCIYAQQPLIHCVADIVKYCESKGYGDPDSTNRLATWFIPRPPSFIHAEVRDELSTIGIQIEGFTFNPGSHFLKLTWGT